MSKKLDHEKRGRRDQGNASRFQDRLGRESVTVIAHQSFRARDMADIEFVLEWPHLRDNQRDWWERSLQWMRDNPQVSLPPNHRRSLERALKTIEIHQRTGILPDPNKRARRGPPWEKKPLPDWLTKGRK